MATAWVADTVTTDTEATPDVVAELLPWILTMETMVVVAGSTDGRVDSGSTVEVTTRKEVTTTVGMTACEDVIAKDEAT